MTLENDSGLTVVAGVDGCRGGWVVAYLVMRPNNEYSIITTICPAFDDVLHLTRTAEHVAVDMPIGLLDQWNAGGRPCDIEARTRLTGPRKSSVFPAPTREHLDAKDFGEVSGLSLQSFAIVPKIRDIDTTVTPEVQSRVVEVHPELAFMDLGGESVEFNKKTAEGKRARLTLLERVFPGVKQVLTRDKAALAKGKAGDDDLIDAYVLAWVALKRARGTAKRLDACERDSKGLEMTMWY